MQATLTSIIVMYRVNIFVLNVVIIYFGICQCRYAFVSDFVHLLNVAAVVCRYSRSLHFYTHVFLRIQKCLLF